MAYPEDVATLAKLEKFRLIALICAVSLLILSWFFDHDRVFDIGRAIAWGAAGVITVLEARLVKKLGRDADFTWLRAAFFFVIAIACVVGVW